MGILAERCAAIARRCDDLKPLEEPVRQLLWEGNRTAVLAGKTPQGATVAPLKPSTLKRRKGNGPPRAEHGAAARIITGCVIAVTAGVGRLGFTQSWPNFRPVEPLDRGTPNMAARPTFGFRPEDLDAIRGKLRTHVIEGK